MLVFAWFGSSSSGSARSSVSDTRSCCYSPCVRRTVVRFTSNVQSGVTKINSLHGAGLYFRAAVMADVTGTLCFKINIKTDFPHSRHSAVVTAKTKLRQHL